MLPDISCLGGGSTEETPAASYLGSGSALDRGCLSRHMDSQALGQNWRLGRGGGGGQGEEASCHPEAQVQGAERDRRGLGTTRTQTVRRQQDAGQ